eukprot:2048959-Rhodomonas_salina.1
MQLAYTSHICCHDVLLMYVGTHTVCGRTPSARTLHALSGRFQSLVFHALCCSLVRVLSGQPQGELRR